MSLSSQIQNDEINFILNQALQANESGESDSEFLIEVDAFPKDLNKKLKTPKVLILQMSVIDISTGNKVDEFSSTLELDKLLNQ